MARKKKILHKTARGVMVYPYLTKPDSFKGKERFKCDFRVASNEPQTEELLGLIEKLLENQKAKDKINNDGDEVTYVDEYVPYSIDENAGMMTFKTALNRLGNVGKRDQFEQRPFVYDAKGDIVPSTVEVWTGTEGILNVEVYAWSMDGEGGLKVGVSLRLRAAQIILLADRDDRKAEEYGFTAVDGGYDSNAASAPEDGEDSVDTGNHEEY